MFPFENTYVRLPERMYARISTWPVPAPEMIALNEPLARDLGLDVAALRSPAGVAVLSGSALPEGAEPLAQAYAGHQFGGWVPQLGDGRAMLLGEVRDHEGRLWDIQLKGSGPTPFSRGGDGRAPLGAVLREYVVSEAMQALGVPTTRALAAVATGAKVRREEMLPGGVLTRAATSHMRVGTFQYFAARGDREALERLVDYTIARHYPEIDGPLALLEAVVAAQARLIAQWMGLGFIHGVMNTDNTHLGGLTIDYGPCAFMDGYVPGKVFSSIDRMGRYAYDRQPRVIVWNLAQFATSLIPVMGEDQEAAIGEATQAVAEFTPQFSREWLRIFRAKLGLAEEAPDGIADENDVKLIAAFLDLMAREEADFTNTFRALARGNAEDEFTDRAAYREWHEAWLARRAREASAAQEQLALMQRTSPVLIARNHRVEEAIGAAYAGDFAPFHRLNAALRRPYEEQAEFADLARRPAPAEEVKRTFCGT